MRLTGLKVRKAVELELDPETIFNITKTPEGDISAKEIYEENITHSSEIANKHEIFKEDFLLIYDDEKKIVKINENLDAYIFNSYVSYLVNEDIKSESKVESEMTKEVIFLNKKILNYKEFTKNIMDAHSFLGKFERGILKKRFVGIGSFNMEDYALNHSIISMSDVHLLDFYVKDSNLVSTISMILTANYENDIVEQKEYFENDEYERMLDTVKRHKHFILSGLSLGLK